MSKCKYYLEKEVVSYDGGITWNETGVTRKGNLYEESSEDCIDPSIQYRWINMNVTSDYICDGTNKYYKQKKQVSYDGIIWQDVTPAEYQRGSIYEVNSPDCQPTYRWINMDISTDYICDGTTKYYKQKKQVSYGGQEWQDVIPYQYQRGAAYETHSTDCGYVPPTPQYRWVNMDIATDYICDGTNKYYKQKKQVSYDEGQTWADVTPAEYQRGDVYETKSTDCGYTPEPIYRWTNMDIATDYICDGTTKYYKQKKQISFDGGQTWADVTPAEYQRGDVYETKSTDCGYVPPVPTGTKFQATYSDGSTYSKKCDQCKALSDKDTKQTGYDYEKMTTAAIGDCITVIGDSAFKNCSGLTSVTIPNSVTYFYSYVFQNCISLKSVVIPNSVKTIGSMVFGTCKSLTSVTISNSITKLSFSLFSDCSGLTSVTIPDSVTEIGGSAFWGCSSLTGITIPNSVTSIGSGAFESCTSFTSVVIPNSVTSIGNGAFWGCSSLTGITIPNSVTSIGDSAFTYCSSLTSIVIPSGVTSIGDSVFNGCTSFTSIGSVGSGASVEIPNSVTSIGSSAFTHCYSLTSIDIPSGVTSIGQGAFESCSGLTSVTIPDSVTEIDWYAFEECSGLTTCTIGSGVTSIGGSAFESCSSLASVVIPNSVTTIGDSAFRGCSSLASVTIEATTPPTLYSSAFYYTPSTMKIYVPAQSVETYKSAWSDYSSRIQPIA